MLIGLLMIVGGAVLVMFGRSAVWRVCAGVGLGCAGLAVGKVAATALDVAPLWPMLAGCAVLAALGVGLARLCWALVLASVLAAGGLLFVLHRILPADAANLPAGFSGEGLTFVQWLSQAGRAVWDWLKWMTTTKPLWTIPTSAVAVLVGLFVGIGRPAFTRILATSVLGAGACVGGACIVLRALKSDLNLTGGVKTWVLLGCWAAMALAGMTVQWRGELRSKKKTDETAEAAPPAPKPKAAK